MTPDKNSRNCNNQAKALQSSEIYSVTVNRNEKYKNSLSDIHESPQPNIWTLISLVNR